MVKQRAMRDYAEAWRRLPLQARQMVLAFVAGGLIAAVVWHLAGW